MGPDIETVLVPVDASEAAERAMACGLAIARRYGAALHALQVVDESVARDLDAGDADPDTVASTHLDFMDDVVGEGGDVTVTHSTAVGFSPSRLIRHPGSVILDVAEELPADFIVVPREAPTGDPDETIGKSALYVIGYASQPVLSV